MPGPGPFDGFDLSAFWEESEYARENYTGEPPSAELIRTVEAQLGVQLPATYLELMRIQNGGIPPCNRCFPTKTPTSWASDHVAISGILGIGKKKKYSLCGAFGSKFMQHEWGYPDFGICVCDCPSAGHDMIMLDYRECGPQGEPGVVHVDQESEFKVTLLANNFAQFIRGLVNESVYDNSGDRLEADLKNIDTGSFSTLLTSLLAERGEPEFGPIIRNLCRKLTVQKSCFALHADELSQLVYDIQFYLYASSKNLRTKEQYFEIYPSMIAFGDGTFTTNGYAPGFVERWFSQRLSNGEIVVNAAGSLEFSEEFRRKFIRKIRQLG